MMFCRDWWPWTRPGYITKIRRQSNNQWSEGIIAHSAANFPNAKIRWKSSRLDFLGSSLHPRYWLSSKEPNYQRGVLPISAGGIEGHFEEKRRGNFAKCPHSCTTNPRLTGHVQSRRNCPSWASSVLISHPNLRIWPRRATTCPMDRKKNRTVAIFCSTRRSLLPLD